jgi:amicyanin
MAKTLVTLLVIVVVIIGGYYLFANHNSSTQNTTQTPVDNSQSTVNNAPVTTSPTPQPTPTPTTPTQATVVINIKNFAFNPSTVTIKAGTIVTWVNNDSAPHTVTSDSGSLLHSSTLSPGQSFSFTFANTGTFNYHCSIHPMMHGQIVVES